MFINASQTEIYNQEALLGLKSHKKTMFIFFLGYLQVPAQPAQKNPLKSWYVLPNSKKLGKISLFPKISQTKIVSDTIAGRYSNLL